MWAETRPQAIERMKRALSDLIVSGVDSNVPFHLALFDEPDFRSGDFSTSWLESNFKMPEPAADDPRLETALIAGALAASLIAGSSDAGPASKGPSRWVQASRSLARRGIRVEGGQRGWRRGIGSR